jgi:hypothetical protein
MTKARQRERARRRQAERQHVPAIQNSEGHAYHWAKRGNRFSANISRSSDAIAALEHAVALNPDDPHSKLRLAFVLLRQGAYERAWPIYTSAMFDEPLLTRSWCGEDLSGLSLAIRIGPPGLGDWISTMRFVRPLAQVAAKVVLEVPRKFGTLANNWADFAEIVHEGGEDDADADPGLDEADVGNDPVTALRDGPARSCRALARASAARQNLPPWGGG